MHAEAQRLGADQPPSTNRTVRFDHYLRVRTRLGDLLEQHPRIIRDPYTLEPIAVRSPSSRSPTGDDADQYRRNVHPQGPPFLTNEELVCEAPSVNHSDTSRGAEAPLLHRITSACPRSGVSGYSLRPLSSRVLGHRSVASSARTTASLVSGSSTWISWTTVRLSSTTLPGNRAISRCRPRARSAQSRADAR